MERESLLNDIPNTAAVLALLIAGVEILMQLAGSGVLAGAAGIGWRADTVTDFGFFPAVQHEMFARGLFVPEFLWRYVTYPFIHSGFTHAFFAMAIVLALGKFVGERWHWASMLSVFVVPSIVAAMVFGAWFVQVANQLYRSIRAFQSMLPPRRLQARGRTNRLLQD